MRLRVHHLQCIKYFIGHGYSEEFTINMKKVIASFDENDTFVLVDEPDDVCSHCPFLVNGCCLSDKKVRHFDSALKEVLHLEIGKEYSFHEIQNIMNQKCYLDICKNCNWHRLCKKIEKKREKDGKISD